MHKPPNPSVQSAARLSMLALSWEASPWHDAPDPPFAWMNALNDFQVEPLAGRALPPHAMPNPLPAAPCGVASLREDEIGESLPLRLALQNAKSTHADFIVVPGSFEQEGES